MTHHILLVEDDETLYLVLQAKLQANGYQVTLAMDGEETLEKIATTSFDLVLLDIVMPKKDGFEVLQEIRQQEIYKDLPIIITSNLGQTNEINKGLNLGATDYLIKADLELDELLGKVALYLKE